EEAVPIDGAREVDVVEGELELLPVQRVLERKGSVVGLAFLLDGLPDQGLGIAGGEILHRLLGGLDARGSGELVRLLQIAAGILEEALLRRLTAEAVDLAVLVGPGDRAV